MLRQFPSEDGYLMLTMGRNLALGRGLSVSEGTVATNGTQPLATFLWAGAFAAAGNDRRAGVFGVLVLSVLIAMVGAWVVFLLVRMMLGKEPLASPLAVFVAALWFASPVSVLHSMNCLETGLYALFVVLTLLAYPRWLRASTSANGDRASVAMGMLIGVTFWARNDAVFLAAAVCAARLLGGRDRVQALRAAVCVGMASLAVAMPWLIYNYVGFGHIVPISGLAESASSTFGQNVARVPVKLAEYLLPLVDVPPAVEKSSWFIGIATAVVVAAAYLCARAWAGLRGDTREVATVVVLYGLGLVTYYGLFFGAPWFMSRFLFPLSPFLALLGVGICRFALSRLGGRSARALVVAALVVVVGIVGRENAKRYARGTQHPHFQVVEWVDENVADDEWVGAVQTGTLGFFHDRTINLDGKVNVDALRAKLAGHHQQYIVSTPIDYFVDWATFAWWREIDVFASQFELIVEDPERDLAVFRRRRLAPHEGSSG